MNSNHSDASVAATAFLLRRRRIPRSAFRRSHAGACARCARQRPDAALASAPTAACSRSTAMKIACIRSAWKTGRRWSRSSTGPLRWTDDAILEEHAFVSTLVEREIPAVPARVLNGTHAAYLRGFSLLDLRATRRPRAGYRPAGHAGMARAFYRPDSRGRADRSRTSNGRRSTSRRSATSRASFC